MNRPIVIGLTGNIATGKSTVMEILARLGAMTIDADKLVHGMLERDSKIQSQVVNRFGLRIRQADGAIDRSKLGTIVFSDPAGLRDLEEIIHPHVGDQVKSLIANTSAPVVVIEAIKLLESDLRQQCDAIWVTTCSQEQQIQRLMHGRDMTRPQALARILSQPPQSEKIAQADVVIDTSGRYAETQHQVEHAWRQAQSLSP